MIISDCTKPFIVDVFTDNLDDLGTAATMAPVPNTMQSRGELINLRADSEIGV